MPSAPSPTVICGSANKLSTTSSTAGRALLYSRKPHLRRERQQRCAEWVTQIHQELAPVCVQREIGRATTTSQFSELLRSSICCINVVRS